MIVGMLSSTNPSPRKRLSPEAASELIQSWEHSGLTQKAFCQQRGISLPTLGYWRKRLRRIPDLSGGTGFVPVHIVDQCSSKGWTFRLANGIEVSAPDDLDLEALAVFVLTLQRLQR